MDDFEEWADSVTDGMTTLLGAGIAFEARVTSEEAAWRYNSNEAVARPRADGVHVDITFARGEPLTLWWLLDDSRGAASMISGRLLS